jgi:hypothetical protein
MTRLIDADSVEKVLTDLYIKRPLDSDRWVIGAIESGIRKLPTIDAVQVVRCEQCAHYTTFPVGPLCLEFGQIVEPSDYCSRAVRKEHAKE